MKFKIDTKIPDYKLKISHKDKILFFGSCFSDEVSNRFKNSGFDVYSNPFGTIFHPIPMARNFLNTFIEESDIPILQLKNQFYSWECSTVISNNSKNELINEIRNIQSNFKINIQKSNHLFITFGTSWGYLYKELNIVVANCHKQSEKLFHKKLAEINEMTEIWVKVLQSIYKINPAIQIIFTVSPVRHSKDGLTENNRSKSRLFELISVLESQFPIQYFPSYEIIIDELRDYRFFKEDLVHPNEQAISYIYEKLKNAFFSPTTETISSKVENLRSLSRHKTLTKDEKEIENFEKEKKNKIELFLRENPDVIW